MRFLEMHNRLVERESPANLLGVIAYDDEEEFFYCEDGTIAAVFECHPLTGPNEAKATQMQVLFQQDLPAHMMFQFTLWTSPDIGHTVYEMDQMRKPPPGEQISPTRARAASVVGQRGEYLKRFTEKPVSERNPMRIRDLHVYVSVLFPCRSTTPTERERDWFGRICRNTHSVLETIGMAPRRLDPERFIRAISAMVNWGPNAAWRTPALIYDREKPIREQVFDTDSALRVSERGLDLGWTHAKALSVKRLPEHVHLGQPAQFLADAKSGTRGVRHPVLITTNVFIEAADEERSRAENKRAWTTRSATGGLAKFVSILRRQKESWDALGAALDDGDRVVRAYTSAVIFGKDEDDVTAAASGMATYYQEFGYRLQEDVFISLPILLNAMPMGADRAAVTNLSRYRTMATRHLVQLLPLYGDWKGTGTPALTLLSRNGQLMSVNLFDSDTNYSALVAAESGSGKSFFVNFVVSNYAALGADIYLIEVGRSFQNLCHVLGGEHMEFKENSDISLNPFSTLEDYDNQADLLMAVLVAMISPKGQLDELQEVQLRSITKQVWLEHGKKATLDQLAAALKAYRSSEGDEGFDRRVHDLGVQLGPYTSAGEYGKWFQGEATVSFDKALTVLELEELRARGPLMKVVLAQLIAVIQRSMYLGDASRMKLLIVDEGWELITSGAEGAFIERGVRQLRKYRGGVVLILQSVSDLYKTPVGEAVAENTAHKFLLGQTPEAIDQLIRKGQLSLTAAAGELLKTMHTVKREYSEMFVYTRAGGGIGKLVVDRPAQLLYTTDPAEKAQLRQRLDRGMELGEAIADIVAGERRARGRRAG